MKTIFRTNNKTGNFTCISNSILQSDKLSPDEIGVLVRLLSLPENFVINKTSIWKTMNIGREHFNKVWIKLVDAGYIQSTKTIDTKSKHFEYTHTVHEIPIPRKLVNGSPTTQPAVNQIPVPQEPVNGKLVSLIIDNKKDPEEKTRKNITLSDPRTGGEGGQDQNNQDQKILGPNNTSKENHQIVPKPSLRYGEFRDNDEDQNKITSTRESVLEPKTVSLSAALSIGKNSISIEVPNKITSNFGSEYQEPEFDEETIKKSREVIDELFKGEKLPNWESLLREKPLHLFLKETSKIHEGIPEIIYVIEALHRDLKKRF